jgi:hypothetical protein
VIRITASLVERSGAEILRHDSLPISRPELRAAVEDALAFLCDDSGYTVEEGRCSVLLRIEPVTRMAAANRREPGPQPRDQDLWLTK